MQATRSAALQSQVFRLRDIQCLPLWLSSVPPLHFPPTLPIACRKAVPSNGASSRTLYPPTRFRFNIASATDTPSPHPLDRELKPNSIHDVVLVYYRLLATKKTGIKPVPRISKLERQLSEPHFL